ncbi:MULTISPECIES: hypothetical protein [Legionella]|uniref:Uncharacterized protein n=1 Tax=Legionella resiliens TaxID=2905958 RepID=A0ABS8WYL1_9GAMM|nr:MULTISPECIES: hypothetical protein [unclassified Legionella]MCE0722432.1 hypothetical protein [Legionella sp. 9fVS26]MCE3531586.1 hypothetical protein [Legionella sp. 8cVS16]QLZ67605.1 hypothetical protein FOLKNPGA_00378 [Legionella sp. PC1000]
MEPTVRWEKRLVTTDQAVYYCSLCTKQLFVLGGFLDKPFWQRPIYLWFGSPLIIDLIDYWEKAKNLLSELHLGKLIYLILSIILTAFAYFFFK